MIQDRVLSRVLVGLWGIPLILGVTYVGGIPFALLITAISIVGLKEYFGIQNASGRNTMTILGNFCALCILLAWAVRPELLSYVLISAFLMIAIVGTLRGRSHYDIMATFTGLVYIPLFAGALIFLRNGSASQLIDIGKNYQLMGCVWGTVWICDTSAYAVGRAIGRHPLAPRLSPKKTIEGFVAGFLGALIFILICWKLEVIAFDIAVVTGVSVGLVGQLGDLVESSLKRNAGIKDSGTILPGHGGILDRFDSLLMSAPIIALYVAISSYIN